jgi:hypothetical protein
MTSKVVYRFYPSLLNTYSRFLQGKISEQEVLDRINRVPIPQTEAQFRGVSFEDAVLKKIGEEQFDPQIIATVRQKLPSPIVKTQAYCQYQVGDVMIYGFVDVVGRKEAVDIKTTSHLRNPTVFTRPPKLLFTSSLRRGVRQMRYLITDFVGVYEEIYRSASADFEGQLEELYSFKMFLEEHREQITDAKIFAKKK